MTLKVFRAGNSDVVALSPMFKDKFGIKTGSKIVALDTPEGILLTPVKKGKKATQKSDKDFEKWWKMFEEENGGILDGLA